MWNEYEASARLLLKKIYTAIYKIAMDNLASSDINEDTTGSIRRLCFPIIDEGAAIECTQKAKKELQPSRFSFRPNTAYETIAIKS